MAFVGNCQAESLAGVYRRRIAPLLGEEAIHVPFTPSESGGNVGPLLERLRTADIIVEQKFDTPYEFPADLFARPGVRRVRFPYLGGRFYWPYTGVAHARAQAHPLRPRSLPYHDEIGDSFLNKMITEQVPPDEALRRYDAAVAEGAGRIRRLAEVHFERQRARDEVCGMAFADPMLATYQGEPLFTTQGHPGLSLSRLFVTTVFEAIGVPFALVDLAARTLERPPFPVPELPIHPGVGAALGLRFATPERRYRFFDEGFFTFEEYSRRYMAHTWLPDLAIGMDLVRDGNIGEGVPKLRTALTQCEGTGGAWRTLALGLLRAGEADDAEQAARRAVQVGPPEPENLAVLAQVLLQRGDIGGAQAAARAAIVAFPGSSEGQRWLARILARRGRFADAAAVARLICMGSPAEVDALWHLAEYLRKARRPEEAEAVLRQALAVEPDNVNLGQALAALRPPVPPPPATPAPPATTHYRPISLPDLQADLSIRIDGGPVARSLDHFPAGRVAVPALAFGDTEGPMAAGYVVEHPALPAWLLRNVTLHGPVGAIIVGDRVIAETVAAPAGGGDGTVALPARLRGANVHTALHLLSHEPDDYASWQLDLIARLGRAAAMGTLTAQPGASAAPIVLTQPLDRFWKWESLDLILPSTTARMAVEPDGDVFVQRLLYVPTLAGEGFATHPGAVPLFDAIRTRILGAVLLPAGTGRRLFLGTEGPMADSAERAGFERAAPEALPYTEQIRLFASASHVIGAHGPMLANIAFCRPGTTVCELRPDAAAPFGYRHLAALRGLRYGCVGGDVAQGLEALLGDPAFLGE